MVIYILNERGLTGFFLFYFFKLNVCRWLKNLLTLYWQVLQGWRDRRSRLPARGGGRGGDGQANGDDQGDHAQESQGEERVSFTWVYGQGASDFESWTSHEPRVLMIGTGEPNESLSNIFFSPSLENKNKISWLRLEQSCVRFNFFPQPTFRQDKWWKTVVFFL